MVGAAGGYLLSKYANYCEYAFCRLFSTIFSHSISKLVVPKFRAMAYCFRLWCTVLSSCCATTAVLPVCTCACARCSDKKHFFQCAMVRRDLCPERKNRKNRDLRSFDLDSESKIGKNKTRSQFPTLTTVINRMGETVCGWQQLGRQSDGKQAGRKQDAVRRDGRRREQKTTTGRVENSRSGTINHTIPVPVP